MALSPDQLSEARAALAEAELPEGASVHEDPRPLASVSSPDVATLPAPPPPALTPENRRHAQRIRERCNAEVAEWLGNRVGTAFGVVVEDISTTGVGIVHSGRLKVGRQYLLEIPRPRRAPLAFLFTVVRCAERDGGLFNVHVAPDEILSVTADHSRHGDGDTASVAAAHARPARLRVAMLLVAFAVSVVAAFLGLV